MFYVGFSFIFTFSDTHSGMMHRLSLLLISTLLFCGEAPSPTLEMASAAEVSSTLEMVPVSDSLLPPEAVLAVEASLGVGMVQPRLLDGQRLYFYGRPDFTQLPGMMTPLDSLVFGQGPYYVDIKSAPPWFWPEVMKLDYDLLFLRAKTLTRNWIEVVVNRETGQTRWIDRHAVECIHWPTFLLNVVAVEVNDPEGNPVRVKPLDHASVLADATLSLQSLAIQGSWLQVSTNGLADRIAPTGWIRWREGDRLLISFSLLS